MLPLVLRKVTVDEPGVTPACAVKVTFVEPGGTTAGALRAAVTLAGKETAETLTGELKPLLGLKLNAIGKPLAGVCRAQISCVATEAVALKLGPFTTL